ncbi:Zn-ribbon domain-containing OB-fold protein [Acrocarpospora catenulata]|uniref:Zn-ribbon domain-containing OB-fold protein n=1 Tax=Acrocarpospora catenulata TaxID=2836182 RepID=UPI001BDACA56|nr:zinc ribbon domain-containing protein [Acrocarpospora catenulata]
MPDHPRSIDEVFDVFPNAPITHDNLDIYLGRLERRLLVKRCRACDRYHEPPRSFCPDCLSGDVAAAPVSGAGRVVLFSRVHTGPAGFGIDYAAGHPIAVVELREQPGLRLSGQFVTPDGRDARLDERVELVWIDRADGPTPAFVPSSEEV